jgi:hypothetical protein
VTLTGVDVVRAGCPSEVKSDRLHQALEFVEAQSLWVGSGRIKDLCSPTHGNYDTVCGIK